MKLLKNIRHKTPDGKGEEKIVDVEFNIYKFNSRPKPKDPKRILIISCFSEFGCETVGALYCIPALLRQYPGYYTIVMGWYGRDYFYKHLVDEFWEIKPEYQWLRDYCKAFHHDSKNLAKVEASVAQYGKVMPSSHLGQTCVNGMCAKCHHQWGYKKVTECPKCKSKDIFTPFFSNVQASKDYVTMMPKPSKEKLEYVKKNYLGHMPVGIFARGRVTYGRNLQPEFYVKLISLLEKLGYNPIWLGEKQSTQACPVDHIMDFSRMEESRDLETTLAIICHLRFTIQFWTASTRLAAMMGTPYLLFESPDQIFGNGQEGYRKNLCDFSDSKLCISHYLNVFNDHDAALNIVKQCILEMEDDNYEDVFGLLDTDCVAQIMKHGSNERIGG